MGAEDDATPSYAAGSFAATAETPFCFCKFCRFLEREAFFLRVGGSLHHEGAPEIDGCAALFCGLDGVGPVGDCIRKEVVRSVRFWVSNVERGTN